jgi:hypothetical protein
VIPGFEWILQHGANPTIFEFTAITPAV